MGIQLIVGLGNPGLQYQKTRHNVGFWLVDKLAAENQAVFRLEKKFQGYLGELFLKDSSNLSCRLLLPNTFMNLSGQSVNKVAKFYKIPNESILVVHDELAFLPGVVRLKEKGSANGHNGVQNIIDNLNSSHFWRMRIGIGKPQHFAQTHHYVLSAPKHQEIAQIEEGIQQALLVFPLLIKGSFNQAVMELHSQTRG